MYRNILTSASFRPLRSEKKLKKEKKIKLRKKKKRRNVLFRINFLIYGFYVTLFHIICYIFFIDSYIDGNLIWFFCNRGTFFFHSFKNHVIKRLFSNYTFFKSCLFLLRYIVLLINLRSKINSIRCHLLLLRAACNTATEAVLNFWLIVHAYRWLLSVCYPYALKLELIIYWT